MSECYCGRYLPEAKGLLGDGDPLSCGCDGAWSVDGETDPHPSHADDCRKCIREDVATSPQGAGHNEFSIQ